MQVDWCVESILLAAGEAGYAYADVAWSWDWGFDGVGGAGVGLYQTDLAGDDQGLDASGEGLVWLEQFYRVMGGLSRRKNH